MGTPTMLAVVAIVAMCFSLVSADGDCYSYYDHAAQYSLDHEAPGYPWDEVEAAMKLHPQLSEVMAEGIPVPTSRPPGHHYYQPVSQVCPSDRYMLKAFTVDGKQCWVIKPEAQQLRYTRCSDKFNRECHYCNYNQGGISKCEEDYEWQTVWAYCKKTYPLPHPYPVDPSPYQPLPLPVYPQPKPVYPPYHPRPEPSKIYAKPFYNDPYANKRWRRSLLHGSTSIEKISLYLPYQCSCKAFKC